MSIETAAEQGNKMLVSRFRVILWRPIPTLFAPRGRGAKSGGGGAPSRKINYFLKLNPGI